MKHVSLFPSMCIGLFLASIVGAAEMGEFSANGDVGNVKNSGTTTYDAKHQTYRLAGSGKNMWFDQDEFHFAYRRLAGNFILQARGKLLGDGVDPHRKLGWMIRSSLDSDSAYVDLAVHGDGLTSMQFRRMKGADTEEVKSDLVAPQVLQLSRHNGKFIMSVSQHGEPLQSEELTGVDLGDEVYVGLFVCSHNEDVVEEAAFDNVRIISPAADDFRPYRDYIGSHLEIMDLETGQRQILHTVDDSLQAPNWTADGKSLIYNRNGLLYRFDLLSRKVSKIDTGVADQNNNDHVLSFDGTRLGISHHYGEDRNSVIYTLPVGGGKPVAVTTLEADSYLHGWSPDGTFLIYTAHRNSEYDIFRISANGGAEVNLTQSPGLDDGSEYSPDGRLIYFNSSRSGKMQIWKMDANGDMQTQVTDDNQNNWFPHLSPDGKRMVILSFDASVAADDHPFYKHVTIRMLEKKGVAWSEPRIVAYVYGGQGTINVPSWSPDGKQIAFVSNSNTAAIKQ